VSIGEIGPAHATHRDPPRGRITVEEVLRGRIPRPLPPPAAGERVIVFGNVVPSHPYRVLGWVVYRATAGNLDVARRHMAPAERAGWLQLPLFLVIVGAPVAGIVLAVRGRLRVGDLELHEHPRGPARHLPRARRHGARRHHPADRRSHPRTRRARPETNSSANTIFLNRAWSMRSKSAMPTASPATAGTAKSTVKRPTSAVTSPAHQ
jgi:hypothetical protein